MDILSSLIYAASGVFAIIITGLVFFIVGRYLVKDQIQRWE